MGSTGDRARHEASPRGRGWPPKSGRRRVLVGLGLVLLAAGVTGVRASYPEMPAEQRMATDVGAGSGGDRFAELASQHGNYCSLDPDTVMGYPDDRHMQGSCCNPMDRDHYRQQLDGLQRYADIRELPRDPYDIEASLAKQLLRYDDTITLDHEDQATFGEAMGMTDDGGPCC